MSRSEFHRACRVIADALAGVATDVAAQEESELDEARSLDDYLPLLVGRLSPQLEQALGQFHDYRALAGRLLRNVSVHIERVSPGKNFEDQLSASPHELVAAYWTAVLMIDKLDAALFLLRPESITNTVDPPFRFHGLVAKYVKIYRTDFEAKDLRHIYEGSSYGSLEMNSLAASVFPLTFVDNAVKYAPAGSTIVSRFSETNAEILYSVRSRGPRIAISERSRIFEPFFRGEAAKASAAEGMGFGLAVCRLVAARVNAVVTVDQAVDSVDGRHFETTFTVVLPRHGGRN